MKQHIKKLTAAAVISTSLFAINYIWYESSNKRYSNNSNEKPLAYVGEVIDDIQRRPAARLLWQSVNQGEALFNGEAIRTSEKGEVRIQFAGTDKYLDLEPESLIVIKQSSGEIALDLMEGSLFVNASAATSGEGADMGIVLNSASGKVDLSKTTASLSKTKGQEINLQVIEGSASIQGKDGKTKELSAGTTGSLTSNGEVYDSSKIKILSPTPGKEILRNPETLEPVEFSWSGFPEDVEVSLWVGPSRKALESIKSTTEGQLTATLPIGKNYWKLIATKDNQVVAESPLYRNEIIADATPATLPTTITPKVDLNWSQPESEVSVNYINEPEVSVTWKNPQSEQVDKYRVKIKSHDDEGSTPPIEQFTNETTLKAAVPKPGRYIASIEALDKNGIVIGTAPEKILNVSELPKISTPEFMAEGETIAAAKDGTLNLAWSPINDAKEYELTIFKNGKELKKMRYKKTGTSIKNLMPGEYQAQIVGIDKHGRSSEGHDQKTITVPETSGLKAPSLKKIKVN